MNFEESIILYYCEKYDVRPSEVREELDKINENLREIVELRESKDKQRKCWNCDVILSKENCSKGLGILCNECSRKYAKTFFEDNGLLQGETTICKNEK